MVLAFINESMKLKFSQWLKLRREILGLTQKDIAKVLNIRPSTVSNWEKNVSKPNLDPDQTQSLCDLLKVELNELSRAFREEVEIN